MHRAAVWQHSSNSNIKIVHNSIEHFLWNPSDFFSDDVLSCLWIVFTNSVFQVPPQKIVRWVEILGIGWPGVLSVWREMNWYNGKLCQGGGLKWGGASFLESLFKCITMNHLYKRIQHFCSTGVPKLSPEFDPVIKLFFYWPVSQDKI